MTKGRKVNVKKERMYVHLWNSGYTMQDVGKMFGISREWIRRAINNARNSNRYRKVLTVKEWRMLYG